MESIMASRYSELIGNRAENYSPDSPREVFYSYMRTCFPKLVGKLSSLDAWDAAYSKISSSIYMHRAYYIANIYPLLIDKSSTPEELEHGVQVLNSRLGGSMRLEAFKDELKMLERASSLEEFLEI